MPKKYPVICEHTFSRYFEAFRPGISTVIVGESHTSWYITIKRCGWEFPVVTEARYSRAEYRTMDTAVEQAYQDYICKHNYLKA